MGLASPRGALLLKLMPTIYNREFPEGCSNLDVELWMAKNAPDPEPHWRAAIDILWNRDDSPQPFIWTDEAKQILHELSHHKEVGVTGYGSCGKTDMGAVWAIINYLADPIGTMVLVVSTTLKDSRRRIWGAIQRWWDALPPGMPGRLVDSQGEIRFSVDGAKTDASAQSGIAMVAADQERESVARLIGFKNHNVVLIADEMPELTPGVVRAITNLALNPNFTFYYMANFKGKTDPFGLVAKPIQGWGSVDETTGRWKTARGGVCLHYDVLRSVNYTSGERKVPFQPSKEQVDTARRNSSDQDWWRMLRAWPCPTGEHGVCYSEIELLEAMEPVAEPKEGFDLVLGVDPAYKNGGDKIPITILKVWRKEGKAHASVVLHKDLETPPDGPLLIKMLKSIRETAENHKVTSTHIGVDSTAGGSLVADGLQIVLGHDVQRIDFSGSATDMVSGPAKLRGYEQYTNRSTEIWMWAKYLFQGGQVHNLPQMVMDQMVKRMLESVKGHGRMLQKIESKKQYRRRIGKSPDNADSFFVALETARTLGLIQHDEDLTMAKDDYRMDKNFFDRLDNITEEAILSTYGTGVNA